MIAIEPNVLVKKDNIIIIKVDLKKTVYLKTAIIVMITSDKVYKNQEWAWGYRETDKLGGFDPYSASKASAELAISSYVKTYFKY